jgi:NAD(P)-dependent dehydrogenase (short-subunit alcohol dehydrogenase family)
MIKNSNDLSNMTILLTGCTGKLGSHYLEVLVSKGAFVIGVDIKESDPRNYFSNNKVLDLSKIDIFECDISSPQEINNLYKNINNKYPKIDVLINNAAATGEHLMKYGDAFASLEDFPLSVWEKVINVNLTAPFLLTQRFVNLMNNGGSIINVSSVYGIKSPDHRMYEDLNFNSMAAYAASKAGIHGLTKWLSTYLADRGIRVNTLVPGGVFNNQDPRFVERYSYKTPMSRMANPEDLVGTVLFLCSDSSSYCTGQLYVVDGGFSVW